MLDDHDGPGTTGRDIVRQILKLFRVHPVIALRDSQGAQLGPDGCTFVPTSSQTHQSACHGPKALAFRFA
jgi:hypothetical protein